ncbi:hypothetical protein Y032_0009g409 [Ancylostoma ceylanicum]|uniref:Uncharacterized protein n=1 Tax=Ancylostoma ceylanicum TaxID=53326 RepID=A0A016VHI3_9BILA|nr:hypothetical protein Y032_0009g409 [Ancylostoma ceylanicum]
MKSITFIQRILHHKYTGTILYNKLLFFSAILKSISSIQNIIRASALNNVQNRNTSNKKRKMLNPTNNHKMKITNKFFK